MNESCKKKERCN